MTAAAPAGGRIALLDVIRGIAILAIVLMNVPWQAASIPAMLDDVRRLGWTPADQAAWTALNVLVAGTQRCLLELLFGAGIVLLSARLDGRSYTRRSLWLIAIGLIDIFVLLWVGDIVAAYAVAGLLVFPLRQLDTKWLTAIGLSFAVWSACYGAIVYAGERAFEVAATEARASVPPSPGQARVLALVEQGVRARERQAAETARLIAEERRAHAGGVAEYARWYWRLWFRLDIKAGLLVETVAEAAATMLLGMALFRAGILQGARGGRFYLAVGAAAYGVGLVCRALAAAEVATAAEGARIGWIVEEPARLLVGLGHLCAINLLWRTGRGRRLLLPFATAGRTALSLYLLAQGVGLYLLFAPWGPGLWGRLGWAEMTAWACAMMFVLLAVATLWLRRFPVGPVEWAWRRLSNPR